MISDSCPHTPVLVSEFLGFFSEKSVVSFIDLTVGAGGHASAFLENHSELTCFYGFDRDPVALKLAQDKLSPYKNIIHLKHLWFGEFQNGLECQDEKWDGILADLGISSMQMDDLTRGFSFKSSDIIDMRMDPSRGVNAVEVLNTYLEKDLGKIFRELGEEPFWKRCAAAIVKFRKHKKIVTVEDFKESLHGVFPPFRLRRKIHPLTLVFQALRMHVNDELGELSKMLHKALRSLSSGGRIVVISFCSLEDRIVKNFFRDSAMLKLGFLVNKKVVKPSDEEIRRNPRCRSAKMRCFEKAV